MNNCMNYEEEMIFLSRIQIIYTAIPPLKKLIGTPDILQIYCMACCAFKEYSVLRKKKKTLVENPDRHWLSYKTKVNI